MKPAVSIFVMALIFSQVQSFAGEAQQITTPGIAETMIIVCPAIKNATGKKRDKLVALYSLPIEVLEGKKQRHEAARLFDLSDKQDNEILKELLSDEENREIQWHLDVFFDAVGAQSVRWLLGYYEQASPLAKARIIGKMFDLEFREVYEFLAKALTDKTVVIDNRERAIAPAGYIDERICDYAYSKLVWKMKKTGCALPKPLTERGVGPHDSIEYRDQRIGVLQLYIADRTSNWSQFIKGKPSAGR